MEESRQRSSTDHFSGGIAVRLSSDNIGADTIEHRSLLRRHRRRGYHRVSIASRTALSVRVTVEYRSLRIRQDGDHVCVPAISAPAGISLAPAHQITQGPRQSHSANQCAMSAPDGTSLGTSMFCNSSWAAVLFERDSSLGTSWHQLGTSP